VYLGNVSQLRDGLLALPSQGWRALLQAPAVLWAMVGTFQGGLIIVAPFPKVPKGLPSAEAWRGGG
jgi:hypothetical protein